MKSVLLLTDSLGYPRIAEDSPLASNTWTYKLARKLKEKYNFYFDIKTGRTTSEIVKNLSIHFGAYDADIVIIQVGIVDCYPRALRKSELQILSRLPVINKVSKFLVSKYYGGIVRLRNISYVDEVTFEENIIKIRDFFANTKLIVIPIAPANNAYCRANPLVKDNIVKYNNILHKVMGDNCVVNIFDELNKELAYVSDNHHFSSYGHDYTYERVLGVLV
ncbi:hypothetical protein [Vibrio sp. 16]|uniref:hypothetical protein n=1 Tax=Vibrio sp. 16 TaxID=391586 RepID=UPI00018F1FD2|nr:hypothetical protein [Vibrio sp. 16]EED27535.1 hypothetical protein VPMS16_3902 [Vibrio sp. 16]CAK4070521.1 hypothetical protein VDT1_2504 [Vibrio sp. 16]